jgi:hypothetical protein
MEITQTGPNDVTERSSDSAGPPSGEGVTAIRGWSSLQVS